MRRIRRTGMWLFIGAALTFLYAPLLPPALIGLIDPETGGFTLANFFEVFTHRGLVGAIWNSLILAGIVAVFAPVFGLFAVQAIRVFRARRLLIVLLLLPLFVPGISMGLSTAVFFDQLGISPSLFTMAVVQILWALPFAFLIILAVSASFDPVLLEAAYTCRANPLQAFFEIEFPLIRPGIIGGAVFSVILSFNETIRTYLVQGRNNTIQTFIWSRYQQVGLGPDLHALMTVLIVLTLALVLVVAILDYRSKALGRA